MTALTQSQDKTKHIAIDAFLVVLALTLSFVEAVLPIQTFVLLPGFKLGLANIVIAFTFFHISPYDAAAVSLLRLLLSSFFFGTTVSLGFSVSGALLSYISMWLSAALCATFKKISWFGVSVISSTAHNIGQLVFSVCIFGMPALSYAPLLLALSVPTGLLTGALLCITIPRCEKIFRYMNL